MSPHSVNILQRRYFVALGFVLTVFFSSSIRTADEFPQPPPQKRRKFGSKVSSVTLSEIDLMRQFVQHVKNAPPSWGKRSSVCKWKGIKCNSDSQVTHLNWSRSDIGGNLTWSYLPLHLVELIANQPYRGGFTGTLASTDLNAPLTTFHVSLHSHHGLFGFANLPSQMISLDIGRNHLEGPVDLTQLPPLIENIVAHGNRFQGSIDLTAMPATLHRLLLHENQLSGALNLTQLPKTLKGLIYQ